MRSHYVRSLFNSLFVALLLLAACDGAPGPAQPVDPVIGMPVGTDGYPWWNDTVFYQIFVRSFYDSDGDGNGDIDGLIAKLDYLNDGDPNTATDLGVTGVWLLPIHPSPSYHGYDVTDYYAVNPDYGTLDSFRRLLDEAHRRGIRVVIDLVLNHTSSRHPWFLASQDPDSPYRTWYVWSETDPGQAHWHRASSGDYYYGFFWEGMPDLNYKTPDVTAEMENVARFWLEDVGVDGFRLDAAKYLIEEGTLIQNSESTHAWCASFRPFYKGLQPQAVTVGEVWDITPIILEYVEGDEFDLAFSFDLSGSFITALRTGLAEGLAFTLARDHDLFRPGQYATFLTNHDMNRVMSQLAANEAKARTGATLLLTAPGVPFVYYGEEIGMPGKKPDEDIRTPMQWSSDTHAGFTTGTPWRAVNPDYVDRNVGVQSNAPDSLLSHYRRLIHLRSQHAALRVGDLRLATVNHSSVFASLRTSQNESVLIIVNLGQEAVNGVELSLPSGPLDAGATYVAAPLLGDGPFGDLTANGQGGFDVYRLLSELPPNGGFIVQLRRAD